MDAATWQRAKALLAEVADLSPADRDRVLAERCPDPALRQELLEMLGSPAALSDILAGARALPPGTRLGPDESNALTRTASSAPAGLFQSAPFLLTPGQMFGPYRINSVLGRGGMGEVYEAEHIEQARRVALKVLLQGSMSAKQRERFRREGVIAASLSHPHAVYVFGADEINGVPVIAMELVTGGTLRDLVQRRGPLPISEAVGMTIEVVAGLDAAAQLGILHRDVKPANCFLEVNGSVKIGDFGLSISTRAIVEPQLTASGTFLGTPSFASPEQLRGEDLDIRSDIYSVGATLHYLLTGRPPFSDTNVIRLSTQITTQEPPLQQLRPDVPRGLAYVVRRCLAPSPGDRYSSYEGLRQALEPYGASLKVPAPLLLRDAAMLVDLFILTFLYLPVRATLGAPVVLNSLSSTSRWVAGRWLPSMLWLIYFVSTETIWGRSPGKQICGLRLIRSSGLPLSKVQTIARTAAFIAVLTGADALLHGLLWMHDPFLLPNMFSLLYVALMAGAVSWTARRRNGFAFVHDLVTDSRVVAQSTLNPHSRFETAPRTIPPLSAGRIGPYAVDGIEQDSVRGPTLVRGYDHQLRRHVFLQVGPPETPTVPEWRRNLSRAGRLRWLNGGRSSDRSWDAYESPDGVAFVEAVSRPQTWTVVRGWLDDLAQEIRLGLEDQSLPELTLDRVFVAHDGSAKLLDWPLTSENIRVQSSPASVPDFASTQRFLADVASVGLSGYSPVSSGWCRPPLPLAATHLLNELRASRVKTTEYLTATTKKLSHDFAEVSRRRRCTHVVFCAAPFLSMLAVTAFVLTQTWVRGDRPKLSSCLWQIDKATDPTFKFTAVPQFSPEKRGACEIYVAGRLRAMVDDPVNWEPFHSSDALGPFEKQPMLQETRGKLLADRIVKTHPHLTETEIQEAERILGATFLARPSFRMAALRGIAETSVQPLVLLAMIGLTSAFLFKGGLLFRLLGLAVVESSGQEVSRFRALGRAAVAWTPAVIAGITGPFTAFEFSATIQKGIAATLARFDPIASPLLMTVCLITFIAGGLYAMRFPSRGLQDRLMGTWIVPR